MRTTLTDLLSSGEPVIADGGMGTMLFSMGLSNGESPELWNIDQPEKIASVHRGYVEAGSQIIMTNTFGCNRFRLNPLRAFFGPRGAPGPGVRSARAAHRASPAWHLDGPRDLGIGGSPRRIPPDVRGDEKEQ